MPLFLNQGLAQGKFIIPGGHGGRGVSGESSATPLLRFWGLKTPKSMSLNSGAPRGQFNDTVLRFWGLKTPKTMSLNSGGHGGREVTGKEFNDTVFEVLGAENSKNDVVELLVGGGVGVHGGREVIGEEFNDTMSLNSAPGWGSRETGGHRGHLLGAENSKNDVVELAGGGVTNDGRSLGRGGF